MLGVKLTHVFRMMMYEGLINIYASPLVKRCQGSMAKMDDAIQSPIVAMTLSFIWAYNACSVDLAT